MFSKRLLTAAPFPPNQDIKHIIIISKIFAISPHLFLFLLFFANFVKGWLLV